MPNQGMWTLFFVLPTGGNEVTPQAESVGGKLAEEGGLFVKEPTASGVSPVRNVTHDASTSRR